MQREIEAAARQKEIEAAQTAKAETTEKKTE
jgi:hypothetical protein